jgi:Ca2+-binding EF-hand superfamily protein
MRNILLGSIATAALTAAAVAIAQPTPVAPVIQTAPPASPLRVMEPQTRNGVVEKVRAHFAQLDANRDGYLTKDEADAGREAMKGHRGHRAGHGATFDRLDADRDGGISREEFDRAHQQRQAMRTDRDGDGHADMRGMRHGGMRLAGRMFDQADANHDSRVSLQEATDAALRHFDMADLNRDGTLTPDERQQMRAKMKEMHRVTRAS